MSRVGKSYRNPKDVSITINKDKITVKGKTEP
jgi:ribosomal protein L6P/L9E